MTDAPAPATGGSTSIFERLRLLLATVFLVGASVALAAAWIFSSTASTDSYDRLLVSAAAQIAEAIGVEQGAFFALPPDSAFETLAQSSGDRFFFAVRGPKGELLTGDPALRAADRPMGDSGPPLDDRVFKGARMRTVTMHRLIASPIAKGWCSVVVAQTLDARHRLVARLMLKIGAIILFVAALGFFASLAAVRWTLRPFDRIGRALADRRAQDLDPLQVDSPRETQALVEAINAAMRRLSERMVNLQNFAGVAAHQIRTPLSALSAQTELLLTDNTAKARLARVERLRVHIAKLSRLTNQLLGQAMVSYRTERVAPQRVELVGLIRRVLRDAIPESLPRDLAVSLDTDVPALFVDGDAVTLREAFVNIVSNAVTHGARSRLRVRLLAEADGVRVEIADDGPGIAPELWDTAAQPFHLPRTDGDGAGLGLSIAAQVARAHGGALAFAITGDGLFAITVALPGPSAMRPA